MVQSCQDVNTKKWNDVWGAIDGNEYPHEQLVKYVNVVNKFPVMKALDIGFGSSANMKFLRGKGFEVYGVEVSENSVRKAGEKARQLGIPMDLQLFTPPYLPFYDNMFGFICSIEAIYYNIELEKVIDEIYRVLAPKGKIYISFRTPKHGVVRSHAKFVDKTVMKWKKSMPSKELAGVRFRCFKNKKELAPLVRKFSNVRIDTLWTDLLGEHSELLIVTGEKK